MFVQILPEISSCLKRKSNKNPLYILDDFECKGGEELFKLV